MVYLTDPPQVPRVHLGLSKLNQAYWREVDCGHLVQLQLKYSESKSKPNEALGSLSEKNRGLFGSFSQVSDPPHPQPPYSGGLHPKKN